MECRSLLHVNEGIPTTDSSRIGPFKRTLPLPTRLGNYLRPHGFSQIVAHILALGLAFASLAMVALAGPSLKALFSETPQKVLGVAELGGPFLGSVIERITGLSTVDGEWLLRNLPVLILAVAFVRWIFSALQWFLWERIGEKASYSIRRDLSARYLKLDPSARRTRDMQAIEAEMAGNFSNDIRLVREYVVHFYGGLPREGLQSIFLTIMLISLNPKLFLIFLVGLAPVLAFLSQWGKKLRRRARNAMKDFSILSEWIQQRFLGIETIKHYRAEKRELAGMRSMSAQLSDKLLRAARVKSRTSPAIEAFSVAAICVVVFIALREIYDGNVSSGSQISFFATLGILGQNLSKLGKYINSNKEGLAGCDRIFNAMARLSEQELVNIAIRCTVEPAPDARLAVDNLWAKYPEQEAWALKSVSFQLEAGKVYGIYGPSGAGKSSLFQILLGLLQPELGEVKLGVPPEVDVTQPIAFMPQNTPLLPGSIEANVVWPEAAGDRTRILSALSEVGLSDFVQSLPARERTVIGEGGRTVSGGQAQRITLARLKYRRAALYLIDEGTSALDPETERLVFSMISDLARSGAIVVMIAHRLAVTQIADEVLLMDGGELIEKGSTAEVLEGERFNSLIRGSGNQTAT